MHARQIVLVVVAAALTVVSGATAGAAAKQRVAIVATVLPTGRAVLEPLQKGALMRDAGAFTGNWSGTPDRTLVRDGQKVDIHPATWTFSGKHGTLVFRERTEWTDLEQDLNRDGDNDGIAVGTWKAVRGAGVYAGITGGGRSSLLGQGHKRVARYEGFVTVP